MCVRLIIVELKTAGSFWEDDLQFSSVQVESASARTTDLCLMEGALTPYFVTGGSRQCVSVCAPIQRQSPLDCDIVCQESPSLRFPMHSISHEPRLWVHSPVQKDGGRAKTLDKPPCLYHPNEVLVPISNSHSFTLAMVKCLNSVLHTKPTLH